MREQNHFPDLVEVTGSYRLRDFINIKIIQNMKKTARSLILQYISNMTDKKLNTSDFASHNPLYRL